MEKHYNWWKYNLIVYSPMLILMGLMILFIDVQYRGNIVFTTALNYVYIKIALFLIGKVVVKDKIANQGTKGKVIFICCAVAGGVIASFHSFSLLAFIAASLTLYLKEFIPFKRLEESKLN